MTTTHTFAGITFSDSVRFDPTAAVSLLGEMMDALRAHDRLEEIGAIRGDVGRGSIPAKDLEVWDSIRLNGADPSKQLNTFPHFTLGLRPDAALALLILPNRWLDHATSRERFEMLGYDEFHKRVADFARRFIAAIGSSPAARPWILLQHRRSTKGQRLDALDGILQFDPQTATGEVCPPIERPIKSQPQWLRAAYEAVVDKNANLELAFGGRFEYGDGVIATSGFPDAVVACWASCRPILEVVHG